MAHLFGNSAMAAGNARAKLGSTDAHQSKISLLCWNRKVKQKKTTGSRLKH